VTESFRFEVAAQGSSTALVYRAKEPMQATLLLAPGAGAPQRHPFMVDMAGRLARRGVDVVTFDFLYAAANKRMPDRNDVLEACWRAAIASVRARGGLPTERLFIGGKSMGGRIASQVAAAGDGLTLSGLVFLGYPLHPPGKPKARRDAHLPGVPFPMLFVQGSRDPFGDARDMAALVKKLPRAELHLVEGGDHSLRVPKRGPGAAGGAQGAAGSGALDEAADAIVRFVERAKLERGGPGTRGAKRARAAKTTKTAKKRSAR
jgi:predicted alpha/beta-hydrolase family hydrolase